MPKSRIAGSYSKSIFSFFFFLRKLHTLLHSDWQICLPTYSIGGFLFFPSPFQHLLTVDFFMMVILTIVRWYLIVVLMCISLITCKIKQPFMCFQVICLSSLEKCLFRSSVHFFDWIVWLVYFDIKLYDLFVTLKISFYIFNIFDANFYFSGKIKWMGFPCGSVGKESTSNVGDLGLIPGFGKIPWRRKRLPILVFKPGEFHGLYSPWGCKESNWLSDFHFLFLRENWMVDNYELYVT